MRKIVPAIGAASILALATSKVSAQLVYEPFDYGSASIGTNLSNLTGPNAYSGYTNPMNGQTWFDAQTNITTTGTTTTELSIQSPTLAGTPTGLQPATGNMVQMDHPTSARVSRLAVSPHAFADQGNTLYYSMQLKLTDMSGFSNTSQFGGFIAGFSDAVGTQTGNVGTTSARLQVRLDPSDTTKYNVGIKANTNTNTLGATLVYDPAQFNWGATGDTVFVVASMTLGDPGVAGDDIVRLWVNPDPSTFGAGSAPSTADIAAGGTDFSPSNGIESVFFRQLASNLSPGQTLFDELRVDDSWAGVTMPKGNQFTPSTGNWSSSANWDTATAPNAAGAVAAFNGSGGTVTVDAPQTVGFLNIKSTGTYNIGNSANALTFDGNGTNAMINVYAVMDATGPGIVNPSSQTISAPIALNSDLVTNIASSQTLTLSNTISGSGRQIIKRGAGILALGGTNTYDGGTTIENGEVAITADANLGAVPGSATQNIVLNHGALRFDSSMTLNANRTIFIKGIGNQSGAAGIGIIDTNGNNVTIPGVINGVGSGTAALTKTGAGVLILQGANTYNQNFVQGGSIAVSDDTNLGNVPVAPNTNLTMSNGATLKYLTNFTVNANRIMNVASPGGGGIDTNGNNIAWTQRVFGAGRFIKAGSGTLALSATNNDYQGVTQINAGILQAGDTTNIGFDKAGNDLELNGGTFQATGNITSVNRGIVLAGVGGTIDTNSNDLLFGQAGNTVGGIISGTGALTKEGAGMVRVEQINSAGGMTINNGKVVVTPRAGASAKVVYINSGGLNINTSQGALDLNDNDLVVVGSAFTDIQNLVFTGYRQGADSTATGIISSTGQTAAGNPILALIDNSLIGSGDYPFGSGHTVAANAVLGKYTYFGDTNLDGQVTADDYGALDANFGATSVNPGIAWVVGDTNFDGQVTSDDYGTLDANFGLGVGNPLGANGLIAANGAAAVPEPASLSLLGIGALGLLGRRRRKA